MPFMRPIRSRNARRPGADLPLLPVRSDRRRQLGALQLLDQICRHDRHRQLNANAYFIGYQLQLFNNFDGFATFPPPIGDQFVQQDRRKIYGGNFSYMIPGNILGFDAKNTIGFRTRTDDIHIDLAETTGRVVRFTVRDDHVIGRAPESISKTGSNGRKNSAP